MERYELESVKQETDGLLGELTRSLETLSRNADVVGLDPYHTEAFLNEIRHKFYSYSDLFNIAYAAKKKELELEEEH